MELINLNVPTLLGTESIVANEIRKLGYETTDVFDGNVNLIGDYEAICLLNINLRSAERIMIHMGDFMATSFEELFVGVGKIEWEKYISINDAFPVSGHSLKSDLHSIPDCQSIIKKSIVTRLSKVYHISHFEETDAMFPIKFSIMKNKVSLYIDTTGDNLYKRGYREKAVLAPMRETLAYSMIDMSFWRGDRPLCDPFCGSGTIAIEAALYATNRAPGMKRRFVAETWKNVIDKHYWNDAREEATENIDYEIKPEIYASDIDKNAINIAIKNARNAGVEKNIIFKTSDCKNIKPFKEKGVIICNPPYGERLLDIKECQKIYSMMGRKFNEFTNAKKYVLTSYADFEKYYGKKADKKRKIYNGMLKCNIYQYFK